jgi:hypothetical protein
MESQHAAPARRGYRVSIQKLVMINPALEAAKPVAACDQSMPSSNSQAEPA